MTTPVPEWVALWREQRGMSAQAPPTPAPAPAEQGARPDGLGFAEPRQWPWDGGTRREAVLDVDRTPPRVVRHVGWRSCLRCRRPYFSPDVARVRMCDPCKEVI